MYLVENRLIPVDRVVRLTGAEWVGLSRSFRLESEDFRPESDDFANDFARLVSCRSVCGVRKIVNTTENEKR
jgi:hypothetical protein